MVATVGTTSTASVDPVREIAAVCRANDVWLHVDAAYGGALAMLPERRDVMDGAELAELFASWVEADPYYIIAAPVAMAVVCFRFEAPDAINERIALAWRRIRDEASGYLCAPR